MYLDIAAIVAGLVILVWSADKFVIGAAATAKHLGMSPLLIGLTIVSIGTSAPEMFVSAMAALDGSGNLAIGNALGSNITNIAFVLGVTALVSPIPIQRKLIKKEFPILIGVSLVGGYTLLDLSLTLVDACILVATLVAAMFLLFRNSSTEDEPLIDEDEAEAIEQTNTWMALLWLIIGLAALMSSSKMLVWGATNMAQALGVSELVIGLTIVAIGTSLPELAASVASARKGHHDIALGNIIGSNIFNLLAVMPIPGFIAITQVEELALHRDYSVMLLLTLALLTLILLNYRKGKLGRLSGLLLTLSYVSYLTTLFITNN